MKNQKNVKKIIAIVMVMALSLSFNISAFAAEVPATSNVITSDVTISPMAISGSGSASNPGGGYASFTIYSPSWSIWGHANVTVTGDTVALSIKSPNGNTAIDGGVVTLSPGANQRVGLINTVAGTYTVTFYSVNGGTANVTVTLKDF